MGLRALWSAALSRLRVQSHGGLFPDNRMTLWPA